MKSVEEQTKVVDCVPYQRCPICDGTGTVWAGDFTIAYKTCDVCNGRKIIPMYPLPEPPKKELKS